MKVAMTLALVASCAGGAVADTYSDLATYLANVSGPDQVEDFDGASWVNGVNPNPTSNMGVTWATPESLQIATAVHVSGTRSLSPLDGNVTDLLNVTMPANTGAVGVFACTFAQAHKVLLDAYAADNTHLGGVSITQTGLSDFKFMGLSFPTPIDRLVITVDSFGTDDDFFIDDFHFATLPSPSSMGLLGLAGLAGTRRRR